MVSNQVVALMTIAVAVALLVICWSTQGYGNPVLERYREGLYTTRGLLKPRPAATSTPRPTKTRPDPNEAHRQLYKAWKQCMVDPMAPLQNYPELMWQKIPGIINDCRKILTDKLNVTQHMGEEPKYAISPLKKGAKLSFVTLGVGHNTEAEKKLRQAEEPAGTKIEFFGADPIIDVNEKLYTEIGKFFPFAVGATPGFSTASVLEGGTYIPKLVVHVDIVYFLTKLIGRSFFDHIWFDCEGAEYGMLPFFHNGALFDQNNITICQFNMEIHSPTAEQKKMVRDFLCKVVDEERYTFLFAEPVGHLRLYFINFADRACTDKYLPKMV